MKKKLTALFGMLLSAALLLAGCGEGTPATGATTPNGGAQDGTYENYEDGVAAKDYAAAYAMLLQSDGATDEELGKYIVLPTSVVGHNTRGQIDAKLTYNAHGLIEKVEIAGDEIVEFTYNDANKLTAQIHKDADDGDENRRYEYTYDDKGNCLTKNRLGGSVEEYITYAYNDKNQLVKETVTQKYSYQSDEVTVWSYTYDDKGNLASRLNEKGSGKRYQYDAAGRVTEKKEVWANSDDFNRHVYAYDEQGRIVKDRYESGEGTWSEYTYGYDPRGTQYELTYTLSTDTATYTATFDKNGNITTQDFTASYGTTSHEEYDAAGNVVKKDMTWESGRAQTYTFAYNEYGYRTAETCKNAEQTLYDYTVTYKVMYFENGAPDISEYLAEMQEKNSIDLWF